MELTEPLVLPEDVTIIAGQELPEEERVRLELDDGDYVVTRPRVRSGSKVVDAATADLLQRFRKPQLLVEVVIDLARELGAEPKDVLDDAFVVAHRLVGDRLLVVAGAELSSAIEQTLMPGDEVDGARIVRALQVLEDTEVYQAETPDRQLVALKLARTSSDVVTAMHEREAAALQRLAILRQVPPLVGRGMYEGRAYLLTGWLSGRPLPRWINSLSGRFDKEADARRRCVAARIADLFATVHAQGVRHGDAHPGNLLIDADDQPLLLDFGLATVEGEIEHRVRGAVAQFIDPEYAKARLARKRPPAIDERAEQYAVAAICHIVLTGEHHLVLPADKRQLYKTIAKERPRPTAASGRPELPRAERCLSRALSPERDERYPSVRAFADELSAALGDGPVAAAHASARPNDNDVVGAFLRFAGFDGPLIESGVTTAPRCSLNFGSAGVALAVLRLAQIHESSELLALADVWAELARHHAAASDAFYDGEVTEAAVGRTGLFHTMSGVHYVAALVAHARSDFVSMNREVATFAAAATGGHRGHDFTLGRSGLLFAAAHLLGLVADSPLVDDRPLIELGTGLHAEIWAELDPLPEIGRQQALPSTGAAHGWAGVLHATALWHLRSGSALPASFHARLDELAALATWFDGPPWPRRASSERRRSGDRMNGWCNGTAGMILTLGTAGRQLGRDDLLEVAVRAGRALADADDRTGTLCCGRPGEVYAFLCLARLTGDRRWGATARDLARSIAREIETTNGVHLSLFKGLAGAVVAVADAADPASALMPAYEM